MNHRKEDAAAPPAVGIGPRQRVVDLVRRLAKVTALGGAAAGLAAAESCTPLVCDPLPPPITCANPTHSELVNALSLTARWQAGDAGALVVHLTVESNGRQTLTFSPTVTATAATVKGANPSSNALAVDLAPDAGATAVTVAITFDCSGTTDAVTLSLNVSGPPSAGSPVPVTITSP